MNCRNCKNMPTSRRTCTVGKPKDFVLSLFEQTIKCDKFSPKPERKARPECFKLSFTAFVPAAKYREIEKLVKKISLDYETQYKQENL